jgi:hypothetical protein
VADTTAKSVIDVQANTDGAVRGFQRLADAIGEMGEKIAGSNITIEGMFNKVRDGVEKFQGGLGQVQQAIQMLNGAVDTAMAQQRLDNMEKLLPEGSVNKFREAIDNLISRNEVLRLSVKGMTGDFKITDDQMQVVLKTSIALSQKTGEQADVIADKLLDALAKGVNKLDDYGISLDKTKNQQNDVNSAMDKFQEIIKDNPVDEQTKSLGELKDNLLQIAQAINTVVAEAAKGIAWIASEWAEYGPKFGMTPGERKAIEDKARADMDLTLRRGRIAAGSGPDMDREDLGRERMIDGMPISKWRDKVMADYDRQYGGKDDTQAFKAQKFTQGGVPVYVVNAAEVGEHTAYGRDNVTSLRYTAFGAASPDATLTQRPRFIQGSAFTGERFEDNHYEYQGSGAYYDPSNASGSFGDAMHAKGQFTGGAYDVAAQGAMAGVEALITGQKAIGRAIIESSQAALRAKAIEWGAFALGELAWAIADPVGAAGHLAAAAKFGAAAAAAGLGAAALGALAGGGGGGGGSSGVTAAGGGYASSGGSGSYSSGNGGTVIVNIGEGFYGDSEKVADAVGRAVRQAQRQGQRSGYSSTFSG